MTQQEMQKANIYLLSFININFQYLLLALRSRSFLRLKNHHNHPYRKTLAPLPPLAHPSSLFTEIQYLTLLQFCIMSEFWLISLHMEQTPSADELETDWMAWMVAQIELRTCGRETPVMSSDAFNLLTDWVSSSVKLHE